MLSTAEIREFHETGWIVREALFSMIEVDRMRRCFDALEATADALAETGLSQGSYFVLDKNRERCAIKRVVWAGAAQPYLLDIGADSRLTGPAPQLLESETMEQLLCQAHFKRPNDGVIFGWHQDIQHRDKGNESWRDANGKGSYVQTMIVLDKMTADSGPLLFMPGSSQWGAVDFGDHDYDNPKCVRRTPVKFREENAVAVLAQPGDTLYFGPYTAHASFENRSESYRRVLINGYAYPGANRRTYSGEGAGRRLTAGRPGSKGKGGVGLPVV